MRVRSRGLYNSRLSINSATRQSQFEIGFTRRGRSVLDSSRSADSRSCLGPASAQLRRLSQHRKPSSATLLAKTAPLEPFMDHHSCPPKLNGPKMYPVGTSSKSQRGCGTGWGDLEAPILWAVAEYRGRHLISPRSRSKYKEQILCSMGGYDGIASPSNVPLAFRGVIIEGEGDEKSKFKARSARFQSHPPLHHFWSLSPPQQTCRRNFRNADTLILASYLEKQNPPSRLHPQASVLLWNLTSNPQATEFTSRVIPHLAFTLPRA